MDDDGGAGGEAGDNAGGERTIVDAWLEPISGDACGEDLEYDNDFLELSQAAVGKPETQFGPAEPPDWRLVAEKASSLFERTRDLRVAILWMRSQVVSAGWGALPDGLRLVQGLLENFWDELHPRPDPDDGDAYARINALSALNESEGLLGDLRGASILRSRSIGELRGRDVEIALERIEARDDESPPSREQIERMLADAVAEDPALQDLASSARARLKAIGELMRERVGYDRAPTFEALDAVLGDLQRLMPGAAAGEEPSSGDEIDDNSSGERESRGARGGGGGLGDTIDSRDDALRAIDMVCDYLERTEPTNPAQLLLRRAQRLVNKNFLELVRELAPDALAEVARVMGVSPDSIAGDGE
jgi:type VI secretion system protein ImpA